MDRQPETQSERVRRATLMRCSVIRRRAVSSWEWPRLYRQSARAMTRGGYLTPFKPGRDIKYLPQSLQK